MRFSLRWVFAAVAVIAVALAGWFYHRPLEADVDFKLIEINGETAKWIQSTATATPSSASDFRSFILNDQQLDKVLQNDDETPNVLVEGSDHVVDWHSQTAIHSFHTNLVGPVVNDELTVNLLGGGLSGLYGSRFAGTRPQLLIDCELDYNGSFKTPSSAHADGSYRGQLFYEGNRPNGHLLFLVPLQGGISHAVIFDVK